MRTRSEKSLVCRRGHERTPENTKTKIRKNGKVARECLVCHRDREREKARANGVPPRHKTHCPSGHELVKENLRKRRNGKRECLLCHRIRETLRGRADSETKEYIAIILKDPCVYCGNQADTIDHIVPFARGGSNHWTNLAPACRSCNCKKKAVSMLQFFMEAA